MTTITNIDIARRAVAKANAGEPLTQAETAQMLGVCPQRIWQLEKRAMAKLRRSTKLAAFVEEDERGVALPRGVAEVF